VVDSAGGDGGRGPSRRSCVMRVSAARRRMTCGVAGRSGQRGDAGAPRDQFWRLAPWLGCQLCLALCGRLMGAFLNHRPRDHFNAWPSKFRTGNLVSNPVSRSSLMVAYWRGVS
jgi:hypothetical protein